jgi:LPS biosynthesis protein
MAEKQYGITQKWIDVRKVQIGLLKELVRVCKENNLRVYIAHGTLLGAIRNKGFIPWDDDIDVNMPRRDYEKLKEIAQNVFRNPFSFQSSYNEKSYFRGFGRLRNSETTGFLPCEIGHESNNGIFIDIFPMDGVGATEEERRKQACRIHHYRKLLCAYTYKKEKFYYPEISDNKWNMLNLYAKLLCKRHSREWLLKKFDQACMMFDYEASELVGIHSLKPNYERCYWYREDFDDKVELDFEGEKFPAPKGYERCLKIKWGDYWQLPPEQDRIIKSAMVMFNPYIPYKKYESKFLNFKQDAKGKDVYLFGAGDWFRDFMANNSNDFHIAGVIDNDEQKWGKTIEGITVYGPEIMKSFKKGKQVVLISSMYIMDIEDTISKYEINDYYIFLKGRRY